MRAITIVAFFLFGMWVVAGCQTKTVNRSGKKDLAGTWVGVNLQQVNKDYSQDGLAPLGQFPIERYGYATLSFQADSGYELLVTVMRDVVVKRQVMGREVEQKLLAAKAEFKRRGKCLTTDSTLCLFEPPKQDTLVSGWYFFEERNLHLTLTDQKGNKWISVWQKE
ncbi:MAG: hypothetical protein HGB11_01245 [Chlorobiales bacterium]|nr:hypothetical protein [Chlorobiales bacterium]